MQNGLAADAPSGPVIARVAALSDVGRVRTNNEDAFGVTELGAGEPVAFPGGARERTLGEAGLLLALSDGMGGHKAGEVASNMVITTFTECLLRDSQNRPLEERIVSAARRANSDVMAAAMASDKHGMGATLTAVLLRGKWALIAQVGDSRAYLLRRGELRQLTHDQSLTQFLVDSGALSADQAKNSPRKNVILQAMGHAENLRVATSLLELRQDDRILLCCDGVSNSMTDEEIREILKGPDPDLACRELVKLANERGGADNLTTIVACVDGPGLAPPAEGESIDETLQTLQDFGPNHASLS